MTAALRLVEEPLARPTTAEALEDILADDGRMWGRFESACRAGVPELREFVLVVRTELGERGHVFESHHEQFEETFAALLGLAEDLLPSSPGAVRGRLRERVRESVRPRLEGGVKIFGSVDCHRAVEVVLAYEDRLFDETALAAGHGHARLYAAARRIREGLASIGREYRVEDVEDELWVLVREIAPGSPAARPDAERLWGLWTRAQEYVSAHDPGGVLGDGQRQEHEVRILRALRDHDLPRYRAALRDLCRSAGDAAREAERNDGGEGGENEV